jgi:arsenate reductase
MAGDESKVFGAGVNTNIPGVYEEMKAKALFLCTGNSARSQMAEAYLREYGGDRFEAYSAGIDPTEIHPLTVQVLEETGINLDGQYAKSVREYLGKTHFGYLITVCDNAEKNCPTAFMGIAHRMYWSLEDPAKFEGTDEQKLQKFREIRDQISFRVQTWLGEVEV